MATIHHSNANVGDNTAEMEQLVANYWGSVVEEKVFPIPFWKAIDLFEASPSETIALHVTDSGNRALVNAEWESYNEEFDTLLMNAPDLTAEYYFVLHESDFLSIRTTALVEDPPPNNFLLWGRLGKVTADATVLTAFIMGAYGTIYGTGSGGEGASTGFRIPPNT